MLVDKYRAACKHLYKKEITNALYKLCVLFQMTNTNEENLAHSNSEKKHVFGIKCKLKRFLDHCSYAFLCK